MQQRGTDLRVRTETGGACRRRLQRVEQAGELGPGLGCFGGRVGVADQGGADVDPHPAAGVDLGRTDEDRRVELAVALASAADQRDDAAVVAAPSRLVPRDHPAGALQRASR